MTTDLGRQPDPGTGTGDLTNAKLWDDIWVNRAPPRRGVLSWLRERVHWRFDRMLGRIADRPGKPDASVLEIGCAPGDILARLHRLRPGLRLNGVDYAAEGCRMAQAKLGPTAAIYEGDMRTAVLPRRHDLVLSCGLIEHFDDPVEVLRCHRRFAAPGGWVAVTMPNYNAWAVNFFVRRFSPDLLKTHNLAVMDTKVLATSLAAAGLVDVAVGQDGGPQLVTEITRKGFAAQCFRFLGQMWNTAVAVLPGVGWNSNLWGVGRVPTDAA